MNTLQLQRPTPVVGSRGQRAAIGRSSGQLIPFKSSGVFCRRGSPARGKLSVNAQLDGLEGAFSSAAHQAVDSLPSWADNVAAAFTTYFFLLGNAAPDAVVDALPQGAGQALADAAANVDPSAAAEAVDAASKNDGFFGFFAETFEAFLKVLDSGLESLNVPYSYGFAIILLTVLVKVATYPLTKKQVESTLALQSLQPRVKELQAKYAGDAERLQIETAKLYQTAGVNPLAGCLPTLVTIPVFIGLYKALSNVADEGLLTEGFFWIPSLAGPTKLNGGLSWLWPAGGAPPLGWAATAQYLVLPVLLVLSQYYSQKVISPPQQNQDPQQQQVNAILKFLPLMIGWFSLNVPSGLTLYWFANNIITTAQQAWLRSRFQAPELAAAGPVGTIVNPKVEEEEEKRPTGKELNARRSPKQLEGGAPAAGSGSSGEKFRAIKAREAARKAAAEAARAGGAAPAAASAPAPAAPARGSKFAEIKAREAAAKAAAGGGGAASAEQALDKIAAARSSNGAEAAAAAAPAAVAVEVAEVLPAPGAAQHAQQEEGEVEEAEIVGEGAEVQHSATNGGGFKAAAGGKKGKKGGKRK